MWAIVYTRSIVAYYILAPSYCNIESIHVEILKTVTAESCTSLLPVYIYLYTQVYVTV